VKKTIVKELPVVNSLINKGNNTVGVKLICENDNEELKKYFSKTVRIGFNVRNYTQMKKLASNIFPSTYALNRTIPSRIKKKLFFSFSTPVW
jgi:hypothetical protein